MTNGALEIRRRAGYDTYKEDPLVIIINCKICVYYFFFSIVCFNTVFFEGIQKFCAL